MSEADASTPAPNLGPWIKYAGIGGLVVGGFLTIVALSALADFGDAVGGLRGAKKEVAYVLAGVGMVLLGTGFATLQKVRAAALLQVALTGLVAVSLISSGGWALLVGLIATCVAAVSFLAARAIQVHAQWRDKLLED